MKLGTMADLTADLTPEMRERVDAIKAEMVDAERGHALSALRKAQGFTQVQVAEAMGVTEERVSQIERGLVRLDASTMDELVRQFGSMVIVSCPSASDQSAESRQG